MRLTCSRPEAVGDAGRTIDSFDPPEGTFIRGYDVPFDVHGGKESLLRLTTDRVVPTPQARNLGLRVFHASWAPAGRPGLNP